MQRELALRGHRSLAVDLPGHGFGATFPVATRPRRISPPWPPRPVRWPASAMPTTWRTSWTSCGGYASTGRSSWSGTAGAGSP
ncbi:hypothetical protein [Micromonospora aurantiaca (nom. illeg.)]|uniref:hypothetical protein n=1 Tax=Micromonospora aurantiaca (nom. illeg.) TaxID=47850 RepID=UPI003EBDB1DC